MLGQGLNSLIPSGNSKSDDKNSGDGTEDEKLLPNPPHQNPVLIPLGGEDKNLSQDSHERTEEKLGVSAAGPLSGSVAEGNKSDSVDSTDGGSSAAAKPVGGQNTPGADPVKSSGDADNDESSYRAKVLDAKEPAPSRKSASQTGGAVFLIETDKITPNPHQPRKSFDEGSIKELGASIRQYGILQPLIVSKIEKEVPNGTEVAYQLIAGERRLVAAKQIGLERVPVIIRDLSETHEGLELAILENLQREDLNPIEMARAFSRLQDEFRFTQREIASRLGKSRETVANTLRLLDLPKSMQDAIVKGRISESHGRLLLTVKEPALQEKLFQDLLDSTLTTRELHRRAKGGKEKAASVPQKEENSEVMSLAPDLVMLREKLSSTLGTPVTINKAGPIGKITINFYSDEELKNIIDQLKKLSEE